MECLRTDAILMEILQDRKTITGFLDAVFGFLRRNTDFYHIQKDECEQVGFAKGVRERLLFGAMQRYDPECKLNSLVGEGIDPGIYAPPACQEVEVEADEVAMPEVAETKSAPVRKSAESSFTEADYKNGALFEDYCWSQTLRDVELHIKLPAALRSAKSLQVDINAESISVRSKLEPEVVVVAGQMSNKCKHNDAVWTVAEGKLLMSFDKAKELWWDKLFVTESCIDVKKLDCERYIDELPEGSQAAIQKLRVQQLEQDETTKRESYQGESEAMVQLREAWNQADSPFRGQPFDPALVRFS